MKSPLQESLSVKEQDPRRDSRPRLSDKLRSLTHLLSMAAGIFRSVVREIFDESAYARFLARRQMASSRQAYAEFLCESESARVRRPRCC